MRNLHKFDRMGEHLVRPPLPTIHTAINYALTTPQRAFLPTALIVTEKDFPDVSLYQLEIDYNVMSAKTDTIIIRTGQNLWKDPQFDRNYSQSKLRAMLRGIYDFYDDRADPGRQADRIVGQLQDPPEMEVYIDWERNYGGAFGGLRNVVALMQAIESRLPQITCGLYTGYYFFRANSNPVANAAQYNYLKDKPLWLAWYTDNPAEVLIPAPWSKLTLWQYGTPAEDYGQKSIEIDKNYFNGTVSEFYNRYSAPQPPTPGGAMYFKVTSTSSNIRSSAGVSDNDLGADNLLANDIIETEDLSTLISGVTWRKIKRWWRAGTQRPLPPSPTGEHWGAEKSTTAIWMISTIFNPPPVPSGDYILHYKADGTVKKYVPE